jgi:hypothetical protein
MGERLNGIQEVGSSILPGSTKQNKDLGENAPRTCGAFSFWGNAGGTGRFLFERGQFCIRLAVAFDSIPAADEAAIPKPLGDH